MKTARQRNRMVSERAVYPKSREGLLFLMGFSLACKWVMDRAPRKGDLTVCRSPVTKIGKKCSLCPTPDNEQPIRCRAAPGQGREQVRSFHRADNPVKAHLVSAQKSSRRTVGWHASRLFGSGEQG